MTSITSQVKEIKNCYKILQSYDLSTFSTVERSILRKISNLDYNQFKNCIIFNEPMPIKLRKKEMRAAESGTINIPVGDFLSFQFSEGIKGNFKLLQA
jgi:hypothetical protein